MIELDFKFVPVVVTYQTIPYQVAHIPRMVAEHLGLQAGDEIFIDDYLRHVSPSFSAWGDVVAVFGRMNQKARG